MRLRKKRTKTFDFILVSKNHRITNLVSHNRMRYFLYICFSLKCIHKESVFHIYLHGMVFHNHKLIHHCREPALFRCGFHYISEHRKMQQFSASTKIVTLQ